MFHILEKLEKTSSLLDKISILSSAPEDLKYYFKLALDPYTNFNVSVGSGIFKDSASPEEAIGQDEVQKDLLTWTNMISVFTSISYGSYEGRNAKLDVLRTLAKTASPLAHKWMYRLLDRRPRCGVSWQTVNKIWPGTLQGFGVQLAKTFENQISDWNDWYIEPKIDGRRAVAYIDQGTVIDFLSRNGKPVRGATEIAVDLQRNFTEPPIPGEYGYVLDGELYVPTTGTTEDAWAQTASEASSYGESPNLMFYVFDYIPWNHWKEGYSNIPWLLRTMLARRAVKNCKRSVWISGTKAISEINMLSIHRHHLHLGFEGSVLKNKYSIYQKSRSEDWLKVKNVRTWDVKILGVNRGTGKYSNTCGAIRVELNGVEFCVSGRGDDMRDFFWEHQKSLEGKMMELAADGMHPSGALRDPRFIRMRPDLDEVS